MSACTCLLSGRVPVACVLCSVESLQSLRNAMGSLRMYLYVLLSILEALSCFIACCVAVCNFAHFALLTLYNCNTKLYASHLEGARSGAPRTCVVRLEGALTHKIINTGKTDGI